MATDSSSCSPVMLLFPTRVEFEGMQHQAGSDPARFHSAICGFGPVAAAARTAQLIAAIRPYHVLLLGIAGTYDPAKLAVGQAACFQSVSIDGIGVGAGDNFRSASAIGFPQLPGDDDQQLQEIGETIQLTLPPGIPGFHNLLTCCAAAASAVEVLDRKTRFPDVTAEDMEGFGVAVACHLMHTPLTILRGVSNVAGDRDKTRWSVDAAITACGELGQSILSII